MALAFPSTNDVLLLDPATGETKQTLAHPDAARDIKFSPDGTLLGTAGSFFELFVWETATGRRVDRWHNFDEWGCRVRPRR
jgi:hypothetical protein